MRIAFAVCLLLAAISPCAQAAPSPADCAPVGHLPTYLASDAPVTRAYDAVEFTTDEKPLVIIGQVCRQNYALKEGAEALSDLEIQTNYRDQLAKAGGQILYAPGRYTTAHIVKGTDDTWVQVYSSETSVEVIVLRVKPHQQVLLKPSGNDHRLLGHMPNFIAGTPEKRNFDNFTFTVQDGDAERELEVRGAKYIVDYQIKEGVIPPSDLDIQTNYRNALTALGAQILFASGRYTTAHLESAGVSTWMQIYSSEASLQLVVIEEKALTLSIVPPAADAMKKALDTEGHVALYVPFDFDRATLKPEAAPVIALMVKLLKDNPGLKVAIEGHTDNIGGADYNLKLSGARATTVLVAVVAGGVAADRLNAAGIGADRPIADNATAEGRAKNRRVELVKG